MGSRAASLVAVLSALVACSSSGGGGSPAPSDTGVVTDTAPLDTAPPVGDPYQAPLFDHARIVSDSKQPNFQKVDVDVAPLAHGPFADVKLVLDLESTCFPFAQWATNPPPSGENWPADCDAFDRNFETWLIDPAAAKDSPSMELVRAITPFGGPEHIEEDVTDVFNVLAREGKTRTLEIRIATWPDGTGKVTGSNGGWTISAHLEVTPGAPPRNVLSVTSVLNQDYDSKTALGDLPFTLPAGTTSAKIEYRTTGHGGADGSATGCAQPADEFCKRKHHVLLDGATLQDLSPWRSDCRKLCTLAHDTRVKDYCAENPCGAIASVKASRANWCPGNETPPFTWTPDTLTAPGDHTLQVAIDSVADGGTWRVSATVYAYGD